MTQRTNDGGPAFPHQDGYLNQNGDWVPPISGMTLRDYFAAKAMQGLLAQSMGAANRSDPAHGAKYAYEMADAMLAAREAK